MTPSEPPSRLVLSGRSAHPRHRAGTGKQALELQRRGFDVTAIEIADSTYAAQRVFSIRDDDGRTIPLPGASVDVAFSSNVPEHVAHLPRLHAEICRVLAPGGSEIHVLPTHSWPLWYHVDVLLKAISFSASAGPQFVPPRAAEHDDCGRPDTGPPGTTPVSAFPADARRAETSSPSCWLFHPRWWRNFE